MPELKFHKTKNIMAMLVKFNGKQPSVHDSFLNDFFNFPSFSDEVNFGKHVTPSVNVYETTEAYQLELNAPGRNKEDFKIEVDKGLLTISYEKKEEKTKEDTKSEGFKSIRREFTFNSFKRSFSLDEKIEVSAIQATYENGILKIGLPKKAEAKIESKLIAIN